MEKEALQLLQNTAIRADGQCLLPGVTATMVHVTREGEKLESLEKFAPTRARYRGIFATTLLAQFIAYFVARDKGPRDGGFQTFVNPDKLSATTFFNLGDANKPGHADDCATLQLKPVAAYQALLALAGARHTQKALAEFVEEWASFLKAWGEGTEPLHLGEVVRSIRKVTVKAKSEVGNEARNHGATRTTLEALDAQGEGELPVFLDFTTEPYPGFRPRTFRLRLATITGGDAPAFTLRIVAKEVHDEEIALEFTSLLTELAGPSKDLAHTNLLSIGIFNPQ